MESPAPPPPSPEPKEPNDKLHPRSKRESKSRESGTMEPLLEQAESEGSGSPEKKGQGAKGAAHDKPSSQGQSIEPVIQEEVTPSPRPTQDPPVAASDQFDPVSKVMVSHVAPRPTGSREKLQQTFMNVDIPAEDVSSLQAEHGSTPPTFTPSTTASPGKTSPAKLSTPKSSAGPMRKTPSQSPSPKGEKKVTEKKTGKGRKGSGGKTPKVTTLDVTDEPN